MLAPKSKPAKAKSAAAAAKPAGRARPAAALSVAEASFLETFDAILVDEPVNFDFDGSLKRKDMRSVWTWVTRDLDTELPHALEAAVIDDTPVEAVLDKSLPAIHARIKQIAAAAQTSGEQERRLAAQLGGEEVLARLPVILNAFRCRGHLAKAAAFGRASGNLSDDHALGAALKSMPLKDQGVAALLFHTVVGQSSNPAKLVTAVISVAGGTSETVVRGAGFAPVVDGILAHAQNQVSRISSQHGPFSDADMMCKAINRFHRLIRAVTGYLEMERGSRWSMIVTEVTKTIAQKIEPRLREVSADVAQSLRKPRDGADRLDSDRLLAALNGVYLLATVREAKDSLALNAMFEKIWHETGQNLEVLVKRNLKLYKQNPANKIIGQRLDMGLKMAEVRFNREYADILRRARDVADKRPTAAAPS